MCGVHAEAIHSFAGMYRIEVQDRQGNTRTIEVTFEVPRYDKKFKKLNNFFFTGWINGGTSCIPYLYRYRRVRSTDTEMSG